MTTTGQSEEAEDEGGSSQPEQTTSAESKEPKTVPLGEFIEQRQKTRELSEEVAKLKAELAQSMKQKGEAAPKTSKVDDDIVQTVRQIQHQQTLQKLQTEHGLSSPKQAELVAAVMAKNEDMSADEALTIAAMRNPEDFKDRGAPDGAKAQFGSLAPRPGSQPKTQTGNDWQQRKEYIQRLKTVDKQAADRMWNNAVGGHMAKAMGWDHVKIPIPPQ